MTYRFILFSEEEEEFVMEIIAPSSTTFFDLHSLIQESCDYKDNGNHLFLVCDDEWKVQEKVYLYDDKTIGFDEDIFLMKNTILEDFIEEAGQHVAYIYDILRKSKFLIELVENMFGENVENPYVRRKKGLPPSQFSDEENFVVLESSSPSIKTDDAPFETEEYNSDDFEEGELDTDGFEVKEI